MDLNRLITVSGFIVAGIVVILTIARQRRFETSDIGTFAASYLAGANIPAAFFLCEYAIFPDPNSVPTKLHGMEKFVGLAGLALLLVTLVTIWALCKNAYQQNLALGPMRATTHTQTVEPPPAQPSDPSANP
jgi:hypothetical protein